MKRIKITMKLTTIIKLFRYYGENDNEKFIEVGHDLANEIEKDGHKQVAEFIRCQLNKEGLIPQSKTNKVDYFTPPNCSLCDSSIERKK